MKAFWYTVFILTALIFLGLTIYLLVMKSPSICKYGCDLAPSYMNGPFCLSVIETTLDPTIPTPTPQPYLGNFIFSANMGPAYCAPVWYAFRYVRNSDGQYGPMSQWTGYNSSEPTNPLAIHSGGDSLPCPPAGCTAFGVQTGNATCTANSPTIILLSAPDVPTNSATGYTLNVHRQVGGWSSPTVSTGFDPTSEGTIVGSFAVGPGVRGQTAFFVDAQNPNQGSGTTNCC